MNILSQRKDIYSNDQSSSYYDVNSNVQILENPDRFTKSALQ